MTELQVLGTVHVSQAESERMAAKLSGLCRAGDCLALWGDLGAGKSSFARAYIRAACKQPEMDVPSPTFTLVQEYVPNSGPDSVPDSVPNSGQKHGGHLDHYCPNCPIFHCDLYRLSDPSEFYDLGLEDERSDAIILAEWPDRLPQDWQQSALSIVFDHVEGRSDQRSVSFYADTEWAGRLADFLQSL